MFAVAVKSQRCYAEANCVNNQPFETIESDNFVSLCCNYPSAGVRPKGYSYQLTEEDACHACPKSMLSIDTSCSDFVLIYLKCRLYTKLWGPLRAS